MRTFARNLKTLPKASSAASKNQPAPRLTELGPKDGRAGSTSTKINSRAHDLSRISVLPPVSPDTPRTPKVHTDEDSWRKIGDSAAATPMLQPHRTDSTGMPGTVRAKMERALGADFSDVRIQTNSARALHLGAAAFTQGSMIHVAPGHWSPETTGGQGLLGHELGHVLQQRSNSVMMTSRLAGTNLNSDPALEREADAYGKQAVNAQSRQMEGLSSPGRASMAPRYTSVIQRQPLPPKPALSPAEQVMQALAVGRSGDFPAAYRILESLPVDALLTALTDLEGHSQLDVLIAHRSSAPALNRARLVTAMRVVRQSHGPRPNLQTAKTTITASRLPPADQLAMTNYLLPLRPAVPTAHGADQRRNASGFTTSVPDASLTSEVGYELDPSSRPPPAAPPPVRPIGAPPPPPPPPPARIPWDGRTGAAGEVAARKTMKQELFAAFDAYLTAFRPSTVAALARPKVAFNTPAAALGKAPSPTGVVDIANQARAVLEARYSVSMDAATSSRTQVADRSARKGSGKGQNIFDASSEADRSTLTDTPKLAPGVAWWLFDNDTPGAAGAAGSRQFAIDILAAHHYSPQDPGAEAFRWTVANDYAAASTLAPNNRRQLIDYRMTGWSERGSRGITLLSSFDPGTNRNRAELEERWQVFKDATHESLHLRAHPKFVAAELGRGAMTEGFTEMFSASTLNTDVLPRARAGSVEPLRQAVEGALFTPKPDATIITNSVTPTQYVEHRAEAERIRDGGTPVGGAKHAGVGETGVRAAYFEGHVEYLGLKPAGSQITGTPAGVTPQTRIPGGISGLDDLAARSGVPRATIVRDNPGITNVLPATAVLAGCREHWVISGETRVLISKQNGVSEADLVRANPDIPTDMANQWPALAAGRKILIPVH